MASSTDLQNPLQPLQEKLRAFAHERDWEPFHTPKNLAMALIGETGELIEHFQWLTPQESATLASDKRQAVALEMADIFLYLLRLADCLNIDLMAAADQKIALNAQRYPVDKVRGSAKRAEEYEKEAKLAHRLDDRDDG